MQVVILRRIQGRLFLYRLRVRELHCVNILANAHSCRCFEQQRRMRAIHLVIADERAAQIKKNAFEHKLL